MCETLSVKRAIVRPTSLLNMCVLKCAAHESTDEESLNLNRMNTCSCPSHHAMRAPTDRSAHEQQSLRV